MGLLQSLFANDAMKNAAFGMVKKTMKDGNLKYMLIKIEENGEIGMDTFKHDDNPVVVSQGQLDGLAELIDELRATVNQFEILVADNTRERERLAEMCREQEREINKMIREQNDYEQVIANLTAQIGKLTAEIDNTENPSNDGTNQPGGEA